MIVTGVVASANANSLRFALKFSGELETGDINFEKRASHERHRKLDGGPARNKREQTLYNLSINRICTRFINGLPVHGPRHSANIRRRIFRAVRRSQPRLLRNAHYSRQWNPIESTRLVTRPG